MPNRPEYQKLLSTALKLLSIRPRSTQEILTRLKKYSRDTHLLNRVLDQLKSMNLLDDEKFSRWLVESRSRTRPRGKRLLIQELKSKGIELNNHQSLINEINEVDLAFQALQKKTKAWSGLSPKSYQLKAKSYLYTRGFSWDSIAAAIKKAYNETHVN